IQLAIVAHAGARTRATRSASSRAWWRIMGTIRSNRVGGFVGRVAVRVREEGAVRPRPRLEMVVEEAPGEIPHAVEPFLRERQSRGRAVLEEGARVVQGVDGQRPDAPARRARLVGAAAAQAPSGAGREGPARTAAIRARAEDGRPGPSARGA